MCLVWKCKCPRCGTTGKPPYDNSPWRLDLYGIPHFLATLKKVEPGVMCKSDHINIAWGNPYFPPRKSGDAYGFPMLCDSCTEVRKAMTVIQIEREEQLLARRDEQDNKDYDAIRANFIKPTDIPNLGHTGSNAARSSST